MKGKYTLSFFFFLHTYLFTNPRCFTIIMVSIKRHCKKPKAIGGAMASLGGDATATTLTPRGLRF
jgi:hypothetical protein